MSGLIDPPEPTLPAETPEDESDATSFLASLGLQTDTQPTDTPPPQYRRVSSQEAAHMLALAGAGLSAVEIADKLGRHHTTVYDTLRRFEPTIDAARKRLDALALDAADTLDSTMQKGVNDRVRMESATKVLETVGLAPTGDSKGHSVQVAVVIGGPAVCPIPVSD